MSISNHYAVASLTLSLALGGLIACGATNRQDSVAPPSTAATAGAVVDTTKPIPLIGANVPTELDVDAGMPPTPPRPNPNDGGLPH